MTVDEDDDGGIGWVRAILSGLAVLAVGFGGAVVGANAILTKSLALTRTAREWLAIALFLVVVIILAWVLRRLQAKRLI
jgi:hypothetical protein